MFCMIAVIITAGIAIYKGNGNSNDIGTSVVNPYTSFCVETCGTGTIFREKNRRTCRIGRRYYVVMCN